MRAAIGLVDNMIERVDDLEVPKVVATLSSATTTARPTSSSSSVGSSTTAPRVTTGTLPGTHTSTNKGRRLGGHDGQHREDQPQKPKPNQQQRSPTQRPSAGGPAPIVPAAAPASGVSFEPVLLPPPSFPPSTIHSYRDEGSAPAAVVTATVPGNSEHPPSDAVLPFYHHHTLCIDKLAVIVSADLHELPASWACSARLPAYLPACLLTDPMMTSTADVLTSHAPLNWT